MKNGETYMKLKQYKDAADVYYDVIKNYPEKGLPRAMQFVAITDNLSLEWLQNRRITELKDIVSGVDNYIDNINIVSSDEEKASMYGLLQQIRQYQEIAKLYIEKYNIENEINNKNSSRKKNETEKKESDRKRTFDDYNRQIEEKKEKLNKKDGSMIGFYIFAAVLSIPAVWLYIDTFNTYKGGHYILGTIELLIGVSCSAPLLALIGSILIAPKVKREEKEMQEQLRKEISQLEKERDFNDTAFSKQIDQYRTDFEYQENNLNTQISDLKTKLTETEEKIKQAEAAFRSI